MSLLPHLHFLAIFLFLFLSLTEQKRDLCSTLPKLDVIPGMGWDALTNTDTKHLTNLSYDKCLKTSDGKYVIPDNTEEIAIDTQNEFEISAEIIEHWNDYTAPTATEFQKPHEKWHYKFLPLYYSFSDEYQDLKSTQVKSQAFTCRSRLRRVFYRLRAKSDVLSRSVTSRFSDIFNSISKNQIERAKNLLQTIVNEYGTHYTTQIDVGSMIVMENYLENSFLRLNNNRRDLIITESKLSFMQAFPSDKNTTEKVDTNLFDAYNQAIVTTRLRLFGEVNIKKDSDEEFDIVAIASSYNPLTGLITQTNFPHESKSILLTCKQMLSDTIQEYLGLNVYRGCIYPNSSNFDFIANLDDGSCEPTVNHNLFGGIYQTCDKQPNAYVEDACADHFIKNPLTNTTDCPVGFDAVLLFSQFYPYKYDIPTAKFWTFDYINLSVFACVMNSTDVEQFSYFGGFYSQSLDIANSLTKTKNCPPSYRIFSVLNDNLEVCISQNEFGKQYALNFNGFATCSNEFRCPNGYENRLAIEIKGDKVYYCLKSVNVKNYDVVPIVNRFVFDNISQLMEIVITETGENVIAITETGENVIAITETGENEIANFKSFVTKIQNSYIVQTIVFCLIYYFA